MDISSLSAYHTSDAAKKFLRKRHASEARFKFFGMLAIALAVCALGLLVYTIGTNAARGIYEYDAVIDLNFPETAFDTETPISKQQELVDRGVLPSFNREGVILRTLNRDLTLSLDAGFQSALSNMTERARTRATDMLSGGNAVRMVPDVRNGTYSAGQTVSDFEALLSDDAQLYMKERYGRIEFTPGEGELNALVRDEQVTLLTSANDFSGGLALVKDALGERVRRLRNEAARELNAVEVTTRQLQSDALSPEGRADLEQRLDRFQQAFDAKRLEADNLQRRIDTPGGSETLTSSQPSVFVFVNGGVVKLSEISNTQATGELMATLASDAAAPPGQWRVGIMETPEADRPRSLSDFQVVALEQLQADGRILAKPNWQFLQSGDSREAELAGVWGALAGTFWTMLVTFFLAFPIGVMAAIYLEEFAPKNWFTDFVEVNINNLAAIPSIIFGLFGLLLLLSGFKVPLGGAVEGLGLQAAAQAIGFDAPYSLEIGGWFAEFRSAPFVGGIVLALMTLPTIIIAARASIRAVPPSIRQAALGIGASKVQSVFHHVLPLAMPGMMTGTIIGMAQALGETAPLLMIGMNAFVVDIPGWFTDKTNVMPSLIFLWSDHPEALFSPKTSLAIVVLLAFLIAMNTLAVFLRKRFERRW
ncbi:MAG: DUF3333 domain-containing protein [Pseudomonadota bacterium]